MQPSKRPIQIGFAAALALLAACEGRGGGFATNPPRPSATALSALTISAGTLTPPFAPGTTTYTATVQNSTSTITVTPTVANSTSSVTVEGVGVTSGQVSPTIPLFVGTNSIEIVVTDQVGLNTGTYVITVTRQ